MAFAFGELSVVEAEGEGEGVRLGLRKEVAKGGADAGCGGPNKEDGDCGDRGQRVLKNNIDLANPCCR